MTIYHTDMDYATAWKQDMRALRREIEGLLDQRRAVEAAGIDWSDSESCLRICEAIARHKDHLLEYLAIAQKRGSRRRQAQASRLMRNMH